jgi:cell pole-organizing protein PopZ
MEDILASIRRILSEDQTAEGPAAAGPPPEPAAPPPAAGTDGVLALETSMLVSGPTAAPAAPPREPVRPVEPARPVEAVAEPAEPVAEPPEPMPAGPPGLVAPEAMEAAASSLSALVHALVEHQSMAVHRGGPTLEDIVREEIRPMLKAWLDHNLPPLVERLVSAEIERVVRRAVS